MQAKRGRIVEMPFWGFYILQLNRDLSGPQTKDLAELYLLISYRL